MKLNNPIRAIFFDLGWTIFRPFTGNWKITTKALEYINLENLHSISKERLHITFLKANEYLKMEIYKTELEELERYMNYYKTIADELPEIKLTLQQAEIIAYDRVYNDSNYIFYEDAKKTMEALKEKYKIGIISDTDPSIIRVLKNAGFYDYFDDMTFNFELGVNKPNPVIFEQALKGMNVPAKETVFIDDYEINLDSATNIGIQSILILSRPNARKSSRYLTINKLSDLLFIL
ncbi:HAD family hydrolase [Niallia alba]|uniref:HAD family hydrolase n=1 Tax=Niallia alba TaxID=2729105 RepID=A0A7Y0K921_9BACI|nr:HAD family hydrolase [Niallia alba]NMO77936.1 HAD family hydrolase [Niallia alba]